MKPSRKIQRGFKVHPDWVETLKNVQIVMMGITHPGNIGAVARVMKNMGLKKLTLVSSTDCGPETEAFSMSSGAYDIIQHAVFHDDPAKALEHTVMAVGPSASFGVKRLYARTPDSIVPELLEKAATGPVAIVFGRESRGLTNEELKLCTHHMIIPTDAEFASMNVAQAAVVTAYEIFKIVSRPVGFQAKRLRPASAEVREAMYLHVEQVLVTSAFLKESNRMTMMRDIRRILNSAEMDDRDVRIIRGIFRKIGNAFRIQRETTPAAVDAGSKG
jgi:tRNA (cytidine32/uridine32-2'-O)-methyltransferase